MTSSVGRTPRAFWGAYGASKAAFETLVGAYGDETAHIGRMRDRNRRSGRDPHHDARRAFPGEDPATVKPPEVVADAIVALLPSDASRPASRAGRS